MDTDNSRARSTAGMRGSVRCRFYRHFPFSRVMRGESLDPAACDVGPWYSSTLVYTSRAAGSMEQIPTNRIKHENIISLQQDGTKATTTL